MQVFLIITIIFLYVVVTLWYTVINDRNVNEIIEELLREYLAEEKEMKVKTWLELIEENEEEIIETGKEAYRKVLERDYSKFTVEINSDGEVYSWEQSSGGNNFHTSDFVEILPLFSFDSQNLSLDEEDVEGFETEEEAIEFYVDEYAVEEIQRQLDYVKDTL